MNTILSDINAEALKQIPSGINTAVLDVTDSKAVSEYCKQLGKIDVLFNVAGWVPHGSGYGLPKLNIWSRRIDV